MPSSNAGAKTGRIPSRTCCPPSTLPHGYRTISISPSQMLRSTAKTQPSTPPQERAALAPAAVDTIPLSSVMFRATNASMAIAIKSS